MNLKNPPPIVSSAHILGAEWYNKYVDDFLAYWCCAKERRNFTSSARYNPKYIKISENAT